MASKSKTNWIVVSIIVAAILVAGGGLTYIYFRMNPSKVAVSEDQSNVKIKKGQEFTISLTSNASTGYSWSIDDNYDKNIVTKVSNKYEAANTSMVGAPGKEIWTFRGNNKGSTKLNFRYVRPWEGNASQVSSKTFDITVK